MARPSDPRAVGRDPDPRFTLANERTYLAWNRTALALIGGGLAAGQLLDFDSRTARLVVALPPIALGLVLALHELPALGGQRARAAPRRAAAGRGRHRSCSPPAWPSWASSSSWCSSSMPSPDEQPPGVARERTGLAWERQALAFWTLAAVTLGIAAHRDAPGLLVASAALVGVGVAVWFTGRRAYTKDGVQPQSGALALIAVATALAALVAAVVVIARL